MSGTIDASDLTPRLANQAPMQQQAIGNFDTMSMEQLQEAVFRLKGSDQGQIAQQMLARKRIMNANPGQAAGPPQQYALGGTLGKGRFRLQERAVKAPQGLLHTAGPGRTDNLRISPHADSYVLPADVVSGLGEGNTLAGAKMMDLGLHSGPGGIPLPTVGRKMAAPKAPTIGSGFGTNPAIAKGFGLAKGGEAPHKVPIVAAGGEFIVSPEKCAEIGGGSIKRGHEILDKFVLQIRKQTIKELRSLKGPVKS